MDKKSFPLCWPDNWPRVAPAFLHSRFDRRLTLAKACDCLFREIGRMGRGCADSCILSTNIRPSSRGTPASNTREPNDPGVAVYFTFRGKSVTLACDKWHCVADNIWAIAKHVEALRGQERWGVGSLEQAFRGYMAIPERSEASSWWTVLGIAINSSPEQIRNAFCAKAKKLHPDVGGSDADMAAVNLAYEEAMSAKVQP